MNWKSTVAGTAATALLAWLAAPGGTPAERAAAPSAAAAARALPTLPSLEVEAGRLAAQRGAVAAASAQSRNPFQFKTRTARRPRATAVPVEAPPAPRRPVQVRLAGIATDVVAGATERTAIFSGPQGVVFARRGDTVDGFRIEDVTDRDVSMTSLDDGHVERLPLDR